MRRIAFAAVALCLALGLGWFLVSKNDKTTNSQETEKPSPATINQPPQPASVQTHTAQTTTPILAPKVALQPASWASDDGATQTHKLRVPGDGLPAATQDQIHGLIQQARNLERQGDLSGAIDANKRVIKLDPKTAVTMNVIAGLYGRAGDFRSEADFARKAIALDPQFTGAYINLGNAMGSAGRPAEARKAFGKVIELDPKSPLGVYSLGVVAERQFKYREALGYYEQSTKIDPKFENGHYCAAAMHARLKEHDAALASLDKVRQLNPNAEDAKQLEAALVAKKAVAQTTATPQPKLIRTAHKHRTTRRPVARSMKVSAKTKHHRHHRRLRA